eukprot:2721901-Pyramimonas_sp.AAC.1
MGAAAAALPAAAGRRLAAAALRWLSWAGLNRSSISLTEAAAATDATAVSPGPSLHAPRTARGP